MLHITKQHRGQRSGTKRTTITHTHTHTAVLWYKQNLYWDSLTHTHIHTHRAQGCGPAGAMNCGSEPHFPLCALLARAECKHSGLSYTAGFKEESVCCPSVGSTAIASSSQWTEAEPMILFQYIFSRGAEEEKRQLYSADCNFFTLSDNEGTTCTISAL